MMRRTAIVFVALALTVDMAACGRIMRDVRVVTDRPSQIAELWQEPSNIEQRDLFHGPGGVALLPRDSTFAFVARDTTGWSPGLDVRTADGMEWSVKLGPEAQPEVVSARILWAI